MSNTKGQIALLLGKWFAFTGAPELGPFETEEEAKASLERFMGQVNDCAELKERAEKAEAEVKRLEMELEQFKSRAPTTC
jgi:hypothetical protein